MSGTAFEGLEGAVPAADGESYTGGALTCDPGLVEGCVAKFMALVEGGTYLIPDEEGRGFFREIAGTCTERLRPHVDEGFGHQAFLDALVAKLEREATPFHVARLDTLISPVLQALYSLGRNGFDIDLTSLPGLPYRMLTFLEGTKDNPLRIAYRGGRVRHFGEMLSHCSVAASAVVEDYAAKGARHCEMTFGEGDFGVGFEAESCTFHVRSASSVPERAYSCTYYLADGIPDDPVATWWPGRLDYFGFFRRDNTLFVPDGDGGWKETLVTLGQHGEVTLR